MNAWSAGTNLKGFEVFDFCCTSSSAVCPLEGCRWRTLLMASAIGEKKNVISSQSVRTSGLTRTLWDYFGVHHQWSGGRPFADNPRTWPRYMLWMSPEQFGRVRPCCFFHGRAVCVTAACAGMSKCLLFFFTLQRLWHVAFATHAPKSE